MNIGSKLYLGAAVSAFALHAVPARAQVPFQTTEGAPLYDIALQTTTCDVPNAGTDDVVTARLTTYNGDSFKLDRYYDDRERGETGVTYLRPSDVATLGDLRRIQLDLHGNDGWCISSLELRVNKQVVFRKSFPGGQWLDGNDSSYLPYLKIFAGELRDSSLWQSNAWEAPSTMCRLPTQLSSGELAIALDSIVGDQLDEQEGGMIENITRPRGPSISRVDSNTLKAKIYTYVHTSAWYLPNADVDVWGKVDMACSGTRLGMSARDIDYDVDTTLGLGEVIELLLPGVDEMLGDMSLAYSIDIPEGTCPTISTSSAGSVNLAWPMYAGFPLSDWPALCLL